MNVGAQSAETAQAEIKQDLGPRAAEPGRAWRIPIPDLIGLLALCAIFVAALTYLGLLRFENFFTTNWDLGINQQLLWTTAHGRLLYETGDAEFYGVNSFLQIHPTYVAFLIAPIYGMAPYPSTLFLLQAGVFVASTIPLYLIAKPLFPQRRWIFLGIVLFVTSFPVISGLLYDFHWEAFMPLEFLTFFILFRSRRYAWSLLPLAGGVLTLEVFPFLVAGIALLMLYERVQNLGLRWRRLVRDRQTQVAVALLGGMIVVYVIQRVIQVVVIPGVVGYVAPPVPVGGAVTGILAVHVTAVSLGLSANYWLLMLAAFAFLPLLAPRYLLLTVPWFVFSSFFSPLFSSQYGDQYALVAVATLSVSLVYGLARLVERTDASRGWSLVLLTLTGSGVALVIVAARWSPVLLSRSVPWPVYFLLVVPLALIVFWLWQESRTRPSSEAKESRQIPRRWRSGHRIRGTVVGAVVVAFVAFNIAMSPLSASNYNATPYPGYLLKYSPNPMSSEMAWITAQIPANSVVLTSDYLFNYVANNPNAWAVPWYPFEPGQPPLYFPFSSSHLPQYVLIDEADWFNFPAPITSQLANSSTYGLVAYVFATTYPGTVALYGLGYTGPTGVRHIGATPPVQYYFTAANLSVGFSGRVEKDASAKFGSAIESRAVSRPNPVNDTIWYGPYVTLPPGTYVIVANLTGGLAPGGNPSLPILTMDGGPYFLPPIYNFTVNATELNSTHWENLTWTIDLPAVLPIIEFRGYLEYYHGQPNGWVRLNYLEAIG